MGLESSPVHRNYYATPPKYEEGYPERYVGRLTNKRNFKYDDEAPSQLFPNKYPTTAKYYPSEEVPSY
jgi:hypothetical protein